MPTPKVLSVWMFGDPDVNAWWELTRRRNALVAGGDQARFLPIHEEIVTEVDGQETDVLVFNTHYALVLY